MGAGVLLSASGATAGVLRYCDKQGKLDIVRQDRMFQFSEVVKAELEKSGAAEALISSAGLDLKALDLRYSHTGISLKHNTAAPWAVRQLYYDCDKKQPRIFDQGVAGFVMGAADVDVNYVSLVFLPPGSAKSVALERTAMDNTYAVGLLGPVYSANSYPFRTLYQNCNQWVMELLATAWGGLPVGERMREAAQEWLQKEKYQPTRIPVSFRPLLWMSRMVPWLHSDDHPPENLDQGLVETSLPPAVEAFVRRESPDALRVELCKTDKHIVIRRGWIPFGDDCVPEGQDQVIALDK
nr:DUF2145 domain-containing protein [uncultured Rhodoferax sp.]